jgi:hypothetical protein
MEGLLSITSFDFRQYSSLIVENFKRSLDQFNSLRSTLLDLINQVAKATLNIFIGLSLFYFQPNLCILGFAVGFIKSEAILKIVERVNLVWAVWLGSDRRVAFATLALASPFIILGMPACVLLAAVYYPAKWGALLYENSKHYAEVSTSVQTE